MLPAVRITILCFFPSRVRGINAGSAIANRESTCSLLSRPDDKNLNQLFGHIWRVTKAPSTLALGSIYVFLPKGKLPETSCTETYRIATWTTDKASPREQEVTHAAVEGEFVCPDLPC